VNRFATLFGGGHTPDIDALSALVDRQLDAEAARATEAHVAACTMCSEEVDGMRRVKTMLAAMPELDAPRSFRLRQADVDAPARPARGGTSGAVRWAPALSGVAAALFLVVLGTDFATRDSGDERQASLAAQGDSAAYERASEDMFSANDGASASEAAGAVEPPAGATGGGGDDGVVPATACDAGNTSDLDLEACTAADRSSAEPQPSDAGTPPAGDIARADDAGTKQGAELEAAISHGDGDGNRTGFLVVEIIAGALAMGAIATYIVSRRARSEA
jgi:hypothetical protein